MRTKLMLVTLIMLGWWTGTSAQATASDSLTVEDAVQLTLGYHTRIRGAEYDRNAAEARIGVDRSDRYPQVALNAGFTRVGPVSQFDIPQQGPIAVMPRNNYSLYLGLEQTLYDFGRTDNAIRQAEVSHQSSADQLALIKWDLAYQTMQICYDIMILHRQIDVLDEQLQTLRQHQEMTVRRMEAGTATDFDTLTIRVRIATVQSERIDAVRALESREISLHRLTGLPPERPVNLRGAFTSVPVDLSEDSLQAAALLQRPEIRLAHDAETDATVRAAGVSLHDKPRLALNLATGLKNGYEPNLDTWRANYTAGLSLSMPVFNGGRTKHEEAAAEADLNSVRARSTGTVRQIQSEVSQAIADVHSNLEKISSTETQVYQAEQAVSLANIRYTAGVITNLDLLDAETTLSQARLIHLRALYSYTISLVELDRVTGKVVWQE